MPESFADLPRVEREVLAVDPVALAPRLLGAQLRTQVAVGSAPAASVTVRITEVEAYRDDDPGAHCFRGMTPRNATMFGPPGHLYVYVSHGIHFCGNVVTHEPGRSGGVLLRAGEVIEGAEVAEHRRMTRRHARSASTPAHEALGRGPGNLGTVLGLTLALNGADLCSGPQVELRGLRASAVEYRAGPRTGVSGPGGDGQRYPWRLWMPGERSVSPYRAAPAG